MTKNVLVVDDSATMQKILTRAGRREDVDNAEFTEGDDGGADLKALELDSFDLIATECSQEVLNEAMSRGAKDGQQTPSTPEETRGPLPN